MDKKAQAADDFNSINVLYFIYKWRKPLIVIGVAAFIISSIPAFYGYYVNGGALEIGRASTKSVVVSCVLILLADYVLSSILL